ncbi:MAG: hypothetical protein Q7U14_15020 [Lacisediminimonas sp.]|nr:hypothetical protein [Lacisediminimonas sp.]
MGLHNAKSRLMEKQASFSINGLLQEFPWGFKDSVIELRFDVG